MTCPRCRKLFAKADDMEGHVGSLMCLQKQIDQLRIIVGKLCINTKQ